MEPKKKQLNTKLKLLSKQPTYDYYLPDDEYRIKHESVINGAVTCTREYIIQPNITKDKIKDNIFLMCMQVKDSPKNDVFTNDFEALSRLTIHYFTESYLQTRSLYNAAPQTFETAKSHLDTFGTDGLIHHLSSSGHIEALLKALEVA